MAPIDDTFDFLNVKTINTDSTTVTDEEPKEESSGKSRTYI